MADIYKIKIGEETHNLPFLPLSGGTLTGDLNFQYAYNITWNDGSYWQRFGITDDSTSDTPVFKFQQSSDTGNTWSDLLTIRDNGKIIANTFVGNLNGKADTSGHADAAYAITSYSIASSSSDKRKIWFDWSGYNGHLAVSDNLTFQTSTNTLFCPNFSGYLLGNCSGSSESTYVLNPIEISNGSLNDLYTSGRMYFAGGSNAVTNKPTGVDAFGILNIRCASGWYGQLLMSSNQYTGMYWRSGANGYDLNWKKLLDSSNYTTYCATSDHSHTSFPASIIVTGSVSASSGFFETSDERLKDIQAPLTTDLEKLSHLRKVYFNFKEDPSKTHIGVIAQDIKELYPEIVNETDEGTLNVDYSKLSVIALDAVDQLNNRCNELEEKLNKVLNALNL